MTANNEKYVKKLEQMANEKVWMPAKITEGGTVENILQGTAVSQGPERGHWSYKSNGERAWFKGQRNYIRQMDPRTLEHVNESKVMNKNFKMEIEGEEKTNPITGKKYVEATKEIVPDAKIVRYGKWVKRERLTPQDRIFAEAVRKYKEVISSPNFIGNNNKTNSTAQPTSTEAESKQTFATQGELR